MNNTILQIPMDKGLRERATLAVKKQGFSSLQEAFRVVAVKFADQRLDFSLKEPEPVIKLSKKAEKRYAKMDEDFKKGKFRTFNNVDDLMKYLYQK